MNWKSLSSKPALWVACGIVIMGASAASILKRSEPTSPFRTPPSIVQPIDNRTASESRANLESIDRSFADLVDYVAPAVVHIVAESKGDVRTGRMGTMGGQGSGVIYRSDGWIMTNDHVVAGFDDVKVIMNDGREYKGTVRRSADEQNDIALVKIDAKDLPAARFGDSGKVRPGQIALAIGAPFGFDNSVTVGHISALGRANVVGGNTPFSDEQSIRAYSNMIQTDAAINPGNSGGPLVNVDGEVVGINTSIFSGTGGSVGIGFSIPSNQARLVADILIEKGKLTRGYLGVLPEDLKPYEKKEKGVLAGAIVRQVPNDGPAAGAGMKVGDIITKVGQMPVTGQQDLRNSMLQYGPGTRVDVEYIRDGSAKKTAITVEKPKTVAQRAAPREQGSEDLNPFDRFKDFFSPNDKGWQFDMPNGRSAPKTKEDVPSVKTGQAKLGVQVAPLSEELRKAHKVPSSVNGAIVIDVQPGSVAEDLGIQPGDVIESLGGKPVRSADDVVTIMKSIKWGDKSSIKFSRFGEGRQMSSQTDIVFD